MVSPTESETYRHIRSTEQRIADSLHLSATSADQARLVLELPEDVSNLTIVDLASGASPLVADLLAGGANAYGVDRLYRDLKKLKREVGTVIPNVLKNFPPNHKKSQEERLKRNLATFTRSFAQSPDKYKGDWLTQLSFPDGFADYTVSLHGISDLAADFDVFSQAVSEALRITKIGGICMLFPLNTPLGTHHRYPEAHQRLVGTLRNNPQVQVEVIPQKDGYTDDKLKLRKI